MHACMSVGPPTLLSINLNQRSKISESITVLPLHAITDELCFETQGAATDLYAITVMSPTNYTRRAQPKYETYGVPTEFSCVPAKDSAPFNRTEFSAYL